MAVMHTFGKILVAKKSDANRCFANDGDVLLVVPPQEVPLVDTHPYYFVTAKSPSLQSQFGWVAPHSPITAEDFAREFLPSSADAKQLEAIHVMLSAVSKLELGTPVSVEYVKRGLESHKMELSIHKVFFYVAKKDSRNLL
jgi:hypothetical protein